MYDVYIKNYKSGNSIVTTETKIFGVPLNNDAVGFPVSRPSVKCSEDNADSFDFSMENNSPYYDSFLELKTLVRVEYDGDTIFDGRVLTVDGSTIYQTKTIHCEGSFGYMNDSQYEGIQEKRKSKITWSEYYNRLINNHNTMVGTDNPEKVITRGTVTIDGSTTFTPTTETRKYEPSSWTKTSSLISSLVSEFGGHIRTRYQNGTRYLDWYKYYARDLGQNRPTVEVGVNVVDLSSSDSNIDNLFTYCIPIGASNSNGEPLYVDGYVYTDKNGNQHTHSGKAVPVSIVRDLYTDSQLNDDFHNASDYSSAKSNYGSIYRTENFGGAKTKEQLWNFMKEWIKNCYFGLATSFTVRGYDIHITDTTKSKILVGDCVNVKYYIVENGVKTFVTKRLVCKAVTYDLFTPENNSYTFGIPGEILKRTYSEGRKSASEQLTGGGGGGGGGDDNQYELTFTNIADIIQSANSEIYGGNDAKDSFLANGQCSGTVWLYDPAELPSDEDPPNPRAHPELAFQANIVGKLTHRGATKWIAICDRMLCAFMNVRPDRDEAQPVAFVYERYSKSNKYPGYNSNYDPIQVAAATKTIAPAVGFAIQATVQASTNVLAATVLGGAAALQSRTSQDGGNTWTKNVEIGGLVGGVLGGYLALNGPSSKVEVATDADNDGSKIVELDAATAALNIGSMVAGALASKVLLDGLAGKAKVGKKQNDAWEVLLNETITYEDDQGVTHTEPGFVVCNDINVPSIPSFKTKLAIVDTLIANKATIGELNAAKARITTLETDAITTNNLAASIGRITNLTAQNVTVSGLQFSVGGGLYGNVTNSIMNIALQEVTGGYQIWATKFNGDVVKTETFSRATQLSGSWSGGTHIITASPQGNQYKVGFDNSSADVNMNIRANGNVEKDSVVPNAVSVPIKVVSGTNPETDRWTKNLTVSLAPVLHTLIGANKITQNGTYYPNQGYVGISAIEIDVAGGGSGQYEAGWEAARAKVKFPTTGSTASMGVEYPPSVVDGAAVTRTYTISDNGKNAVKLTGGGYTVAEYTHGQYNAGWEAARAKVEFPTTGTTASMDIKYPPSTVDSSAITRTYTLSNDGDNAVKLTGGGYTVAKLTHNKYTAGYNAGSTAGYNSGYSAGVTDGKNAVGLTISTSDAKIKRNQSSSAITEVSITLNTGSRDSSGNRTIQVKANTTVLLSSVINDYTPGYNAGYSAGNTAGYNSGYSAGISQVFDNANFGYTSSPGSYASFIDCSVPGTSRHVYIRYKDKNGNWQNKTSKTWYVPLPKLFTVDGPASGTTATELTGNTYICAGYSRGGYDGGGDTKFTSQCYHVPAGGHNTPFTMRCQTKEQSYPGSSSYTYTFRLESTISFSTGTNYTFYR